MLTPARVAASPTRIPWTVNPDFGTDCKRMIDHVSIRVSDRPLSERFYDAVLAPLGIEQTAWGEEGVEWSDFSLAAVEPGKGLTQRLHVAFVARSHQDVERF